MVSIRGVMGSFSLATRACMRSSRIMKLVAEVSSSSRSTRARQGRVVVDAAGVGVRQGGLAVVAAADDEGDALGDAHAGDGAAVGAGELDPEGVGGVEGDDVSLQGTVADTALAGEDGAGGDEGDELLLGELAAEGVRVLDRFDVGANVVGGEILVEEG